MYTYITFPLGAAAGVSMELRNLTNMANAAACWIVGKDYGGVQGLRQTLESHGIPPDLHVQATEQLATGVGMAYPNLLDPMKVRSVLKEIVRGETGQRSGRPTFSAIQWGSSLDRKAGPYIPILKELLGPIGRHWLIQRTPSIDATKVAETKDHLYESFHKALGLLTLSLTPWSPSTAPTKIERKGPWWTRSTYKEAPLPAPLRVKVEIPPTWPKSNAIEILARGIYQQLREQGYENWEMVRFLRAFVEMMTAGIEDGPKK